MRPRKLSVQSSQHHIVKRRVKILSCKVVHNVIVKLKMATKTLQMEK